MAEAPGFDTFDRGQTQNRQSNSVTATTSNEIGAAPRGFIVALQCSIGRDEFFAGLYILGCANGLLSRIIQSTSFDNWMSACRASISM